MDLLKSNDVVSVPPEGGLIALFSKDGEAIGHIFLRGGDHSAKSIWAKMMPGQLLELGAEMHIYSRPPTIRPSNHDDFSSGANQAFRPDYDPVAKALEAKLRSVSTLEKRLLKTQRLMERSLATQTETRERQAAAEAAEAAAQAAEATEVAEA